MKHREPRLHENLAGVPGFSRPTFRYGLQLEGWTLIAGGRFTDEVWEVEHTQGGSGVIKTARGKKSPWPERFFHEVETTQLLQQLPGVVRLLDRDGSTRPAWMVTELATPLAKHIGKTPELGTVVSAVAESAVTLVDAAAAGVAHRDIKPDNLFFGRGRALVGDFGLATGHTYQDLTVDGHRLGPANFCAPETLEWSDRTDAFPADVYSLAKTLWVLMAGTKFPPQGPLNVRRRESDLAKYGGRAADDLARLLELATEDECRHRPTMSEFRDELRTWLQLHPPRTTPRPSRSRFRTAFEEYLSARALDEAGREKVLADAVRRLLDGCRDARAGGSRLVDDQDANIGLPDDPRLGGDPDWIPDQVVIKKLGWETAAGVRLVGVGVLDGEDDLRYDLSWQVRTPGTAQWEVTCGGRVRMRLPSDNAERVRLRDEAFRHVPAQLTDPLTPVSTETESRLRQVANEVRRRESRRGADMDEARRRVAGREQAAERAKADWHRFWKGFVEYV